MRTCTVEGCDKPVRSAGADWCKMHYHRWYRHGDVNMTAAGVRHFVRRYLSAYMPGHPLAGKSGKVYLHRAALWDAIGVGPHACHWCGVEVHWCPDPGQRALHVDHIDGIGDHNAPENLVPSCRECNTTRGCKARSQRLRSVGWFSQNDTVARLGGGYGT